MATQTTNYGLKLVEDTDSLKAAAKTLPNQNAQAIDAALHALDAGTLKTSQKGANGGLAELDANGKVPSSQLPSYVDDVLDYADLASFPATGETSKIYVDTSTNKTYRWSGSAYVEISASIVIGTTEGTAFRGDHGAAAYAHAVTNKGAAFTSGLYKITTNSEGHVIAATAVAKEDITDLGIPGSDTTYSNATSSAAGLMSATDKGNLDTLVAWKNGLVNADTTNY